MQSPVSHWIVQRVTAIFLIPFAGFLLFSFLSLESFDLATAQDWVRSLWVRVSLWGLLLTGFWHAELGVHHVLDDYLGETRTKVFLLQGFRGVSLGLLILGCLAVFFA